VLSNDHDTEGDKLSVTQFQIDSNGDGLPETIIVPAGGEGTVSLQDSRGNPIGTLTIDSTGAYTFSAATTYHGPVPVATYTVGDGVASDTATLSFNDVPNAPPAAGNDGLIVIKPDTPATGNVLSNDRDINGDSVSVTQFQIDTNGDGQLETIQVPAGGSGKAIIKDAHGQLIGTLVITSEGRYSFSADPAYSGAVPVVSYTISDGVLTDTAVLQFGNLATSGQNIGAHILLSNPTPPLFPVVNEVKYALSPFREPKPDRSTEAPNAPSTLSLYGNLWEYELYLTAALKNQVVVELESHTFYVPFSAFRHSNPNEPLEYEATQLDGSPLPVWITFDPKLLKFSGVPPKGALNLEITVKAKDRYGNEVYAPFKVIVHKERDYGGKEAIQLKHVKEPATKGAQAAKPHAKPGFNEQLGQMGKPNRLAESRALLSSLNDMKG